MNEFLTALGDPGLPFLRNAFIVGLLSSVAFGVVGTYVVARRITYMAGAISHCMLGGIGAAYFLAYRFEAAWIDPVYGAIASGLLAAVVIGWVGLRGGEREDTVIGAVWVIGMAVGLLFLHSTPGYVDPMSFLFGNILLIASRDIWLVVGLDIFLLLTVLLCYDQFLAVCFDEEFARLRGVRVDFFYLLLLCLTALTIGLLVKVVGIVLVIALLTLPPAIAGRFAKRLWLMMLGAVLLCAVLSASGLAVSYSMDIPTGPTIILEAAGLYLLVVIGDGLRNQLRSRRRAR